jgi:hypothetical protein
MNHRVERIKILIGQSAVDGCLLYRDEALLGVLTYEATVARWQVEAVFGRLDRHTIPETFNDLDETLAWFSRVYS